MNKLSTSAPEIIEQRIGRSAKVHFAIYDSVSEMGAHAATTSPKREGRSARDWTGGHDWRTSVKYAQTGDLAGVARSDALLAKMEAHALPTARRAWRDDVCGSIPNVPAFVAGHPLAMRRRIRDDSEGAPIAIIADLTTSAAIKADDVSKRGAAILALVRALSARRPVELWACTSLDADHRQNACVIMARIETAPLDLATAAHTLTHAGMPRNVMYGLGEVLFDYCGSWPFGVGPLTRTEMEAILAPVMTHVTATLCLPGIHKDDASVTDPAAWIARQLAEHAPLTLEN